ncbi:hypothetical protein HK098_006182 [Nowakowskiella sp. JEL0407]|nr:hypothetical protein HK098_006182 [Nowakowskiella sp. JEL0407]
MHVFLHLFFLLLSDFARAQPLLLYAPSPVLPNIPSPAKLEPQSGKYLGAWLDTEANAAYFDTPDAINTRLGFNLSVFHFAQNIPVGETEAPIELLFASTEVVILLSVYARQGLTEDIVTDDDLKALAQQCARLNQQGRKILLRFCPEMNGSWAAYGQKAYTYVNNWKRMAVFMKSIAPETALLWSPNSAAGYPFAGGQFSISPINIEFGYIDTNGDGILNADDHPYLPYYPGDEWVDWVGMSIYYYGVQFPWITNELPPANRYHDILSGIYTGPGFPPTATPYDFYEEFCLLRNKPFFGSEIGAAFHLSLISDPTVRLSEGAGELAIKQTWWRQSLTNSTFLGLYPKIKGFSLFEFVKAEEETLRDFRMTAASGTLNEFKADLAQVADIYIWANSTSPFEVMSNKQLPTPEPPIINVQSAKATSSSGKGWEVKGIRNALVILVVLIWI